MSKPLNRRDFILQGSVGLAGLYASSLGFPGLLHAKTMLNVGYLPILDHMTLFVSHAMDNKSFKSVDVAPQMFKSWNSIVGALTAKKLDAAFLLSPLAMSIYSKGTPVRSILVGHRNGSAITVAKNSKINGPSDFKGKTVAIPGKISTHVALLDHYLRQGGLSLKDVRTLSIAPSDMIKSLVRGTIDGYIVAEPFVAMAELMGVGRTLILSSEILKSNHICCVLVAREEVLKSHGEAFSELTKSLSKAGQYIDQDKAQNGGQKVAAMATKYTPHKEKTILAGMLSPADRITYNNLTPNRHDFSEIQAIAQKAGILGQVDLDHFIDASYVKA